MENSIITNLQLLPGEIAAESTTIVNLLAEKNKVDQKINIIEVALKSQVWTDKALTNEVSRKATYQDMLKQDGTYEADVKNRDTIKTSIDLTVIAHQRKRDTMNVLIAIVGAK